MKKIFFLHPRVVFHHKEAPDFSGQEKKEEREASKSKPGIRIDVEGQKERPEERVLENRQLFEAKNYSKSYGQPSVWEHPDKKAPWRFLSFKHQMEYRHLSEGQREAYLKRYSAEIQAGYQADKSMWERTSPILRVPRLRPSLTDRPELLPEPPPAIYALGGRVSKSIAENFRGAKAEYVPGGDPAMVLKNFEEQVVQKVSPEALKGASAVLTFDPDLFGSQMPHEQYVKDTEALLKRLNTLGMFVTVLSPLKTWNFDFKDVPSDRNVPVPHGWSKDQIMARQRRNDYWNELGRLKEQGLITTLVDLGDALQARDTMGTNKAFLSEDPEKILNGQGVAVAVDGAIMGINAAHGYDGGNFSNERYWPGGADYELGKTTITGKPIERVVAGAPLVEEPLRKQALERVKSKDALDPLRRLATDLMGSQLLDMTHADLYAHYMDKDIRFIPGMHVYSYPAKRVVHEAYAALQAEKAAGKDVSVLTREFTKLASLVYVKLARVAIIHARELFEDKDSLYLPHRKDAYEHAQKYVKNAEDANSFYGFYNANVERLKKEWAEFQQLPPVAQWRKKSIQG